MYESVCGGERQQRKLGRSSSNRDELVAFVLALRGITATKPMVYLCNSQALLKAVKRLVVNGGKAGTSNADILREAIRGKELRKWTKAEAVTFLVKVKAHRRKPALK